MPDLVAAEVAAGIYWVEAPDADLGVLCGCPADAVKHLRRKGLIAECQKQGLTYETGPNTILLSDVPIQGGVFANLSEFPVMQMLYRQGMGIPGHPGNTGQRPLIIGSAQQIRAQMRYIHRGNYGLRSEAELVQHGVSAAEARHMMHIKERFAFGHLQPPEDLCDRLVVADTPQHIRGRVTIRRLSLNVFEFRCGAEAVTVDLNLPPNLGYEATYALGRHRIGEEHFSVVHSGSGDGWDATRPAMSSVLIFQGEPYLVDAGPNLGHVLAALGIEVGQVRGIFHTHAHDDHFCGIAALVRSDHRLRHFATPWVRASVAKKMSALLMVDESEFLESFECHDLAADRWNDVNGLGVRPVYSPHPVETTAFIFRARCGPEYRYYAHLADTVGLRVLRGMVAGGDAEAGIPEELYERVAAEYERPADVKKVDVGGGMTHGNVDDFAQDCSGRLILAHTSRPLSNAEERVGSDAPFGSVDVLIPADRTDRRQATCDPASSRLALSIRSGGRLACSSGGVPAELAARCALLRQASPFGESITLPVLMRIARAMRQVCMRSSAYAEAGCCAGISLVGEGRLDLVVDDDVIETVGVGDVFGESTVLHGTPGIFKARAREPCELWLIHSDALAGIPIVRWRLLELYTRRMRALLDPERVGTPAFRWRECYRTHVDEFDQHHRELLGLVEGLCQGLSSGLGGSRARDALEFLIDYTVQHFADEETLMQERLFPGLERHRRQHEQIREEALEFHRRAQRNEWQLDADFIEFLKDWIVDHMLTEDQKYSRFFAGQATV